MDKLENKSIAGMSLGGGRKENFFFCLLEFFPKDNRWFLSHLKHVKDEAPLDRDDAIMSWIERHSLTRLIVDFPLSKPTCDSCELECPGIEACNHPVVSDIRSEIEEILTADKKLNLENPKRYEQERNIDNQVMYGRNLNDLGSSCSDMISKSFKRKLRKGFLPYWNRPIDFWVWKNYYDLVLEYFNISYDSFGNVSIMLLNRFKYLQKHFPDGLNIFESNIYITIIELYRAKVITHKMILDLQDMHSAPLAKLEIIRAIEKKLNIFIYENDLEVIVKNPKAFDSFLLAVSGRSLVQGNNLKIPGIGDESNKNFVIPNFS